MSNDEFVVMVLKVVIQYCSSISLRLVRLLVNLLQLDDALL